jgi:GT2 family glycosyltransferase
MKLSVVVPVHNGGPDLRVCLQALARSLRKPDEVIVVDDGSTDGATECAAEFSARVIHLSGPPSGPALARNHGAKKARGDILLFVDADVQVHEDTLGRFEQLFRDEPDVAAAFGSYDDNPPVKSNVSKFKNLFHHYVHQHGAREAETFWAGCGAVRREAFLAIGGFAETYGRPSIEDIELGARLREAGHRIVLRPEILCTHLKRWTLKSLLHTDIFVRAIPWTRLILRQGRLPVGLNTDHKSRWSAVLAWLGALAVLMCLVSGWQGCFRCLAWSAGGGSLCCLLLLALNAHLYRFFFQHGNTLFGIAATSLHILYLLYSSLIFAAVLGLGCFRRTRGKQHEGSRNLALDGDVPVAPRKILVGLVLSLVLFAIYVGDGDPLPGKDATPNTHVAITLLSKGRLSYTAEEQPSFFSWKLLRDGKAKEALFHSWDDRLDGESIREVWRRGDLRDPVPQYYLSRTTKPGVFVNSYGVVTGLTALPLVAAVYPFVKDLDQPKRTSLLWLLGKLTASLAVAGSAFFLFLVAADHMRRSTAILLTLVYGLGTCVWSQSSQTLWQHAPGEFFLALGTFCLFRRRRGYAPYLAGFAYGLAFMCRPTNSVAVLAGFLLFLLTDWRGALRYLAGGLPIAVLFFAYNLHYFGKLVAFGQVTALAERVGATNDMVLWKHSILDGLAGVLFSPSRGLFVYSPIVVVSVWAGFRIWKDKRWLPLRAMAFATVGIWLVVARWSGWWGGWCYGYRLLVDTALLLAFLAIPVVEEIRKRRSLAILVAVLAVWSIGVQFLGAWAYDVNSWNNRDGYVVKGSGLTDPPCFLTQGEAEGFCRQHACSYRLINMNVDHGWFHGRLWNIRDSQILYYLRNFEKSQLLKPLYLKQFLDQDG